MANPKGLDLTGLSKEIFMQRYAYPGEETWVERAAVVARVVASAENDKEKPYWEGNFFDAIRFGEFIPGGRILFGCGRKEQNLLNCYVRNPQDSVESIGRMIKDYYTISCAGGGVGGNYSSIRPKGDKIAQVPFSAPGSVSNMKMIDEIVEHVRGGKNRRAAIMGILNVDHPDLLEFLHVKLDKKELKNFNISVAITNKFLDAVENGTSWNFRFSNKDYFVYAIERINKNNITDIINVVATDQEDALGRANAFHRANWDDRFGKIEKVDLAAKALWDKIFINSIESGDPGIYMIDNANEHTNVSYFETLLSTNPCGEIPLPDYGNCCLGHINLTEMVNDDNTDVDWKKLARTIRTGVRFLDNVLTINHYPIPECKEAASRSRRIGLGVTGLHYMLIKLGLVYGSDKSVEFLDRLFTTIRNEAYLTSAYLGRDKGSFDAFDTEKYLKEQFAKTLPPLVRFRIRENGMRNAVLLTVAPCGTNSMVLGVSSGIEPIFSAMYKRRYRDGSVWKEQIVVDPLFEKYLNEGKDIQAFVGAYDVKPEEHIKVQATIQRYIDSAISKTCNLPKETEWADISKAVLAYARDVKGFTLYRAGSKATDSEVEPLEAIELSQKNIEKYLNKDNQFVKQVSTAEICSLTGGGCG